MINTTGTILLAANSFIAYHSPKISIIGQSSDINNTDIINLTINVTSQDGNTAFTTVVNVSTNSIKDLITLNSVGATTFVSNLYTILETLLISHFQTLNPDSTFELV